jgi:hypothetical protein
VSADVEPRHDPRHHERILCGRHDCAWPIAAIHHLDGLPPDSIVPAVPVGAYVTATDASGRHQIGVAWEPTPRTLARTARALRLLGSGITREAALRQSRPGARPAKRRAGAASFEVLRVPCGVRCPACLTINRFAKWSLRSGLA